MNRKKQMLRRCIFFAALGVIVLLVCGSLIKTPQRQVSYETYYVEQGDTLWSIAKQYAPYNSDYRNYIYDLCKYNVGLTANIKIGQAIEVIILNEN